MLECRGMRFQAVVKTKLISLYPKMACLSQPEDCEIAKDSPGRGRSNARYLGVGGQCQGLVGHLGSRNSGELIGTFSMRLMLEVSWIWDAIRTSFRGATTKNCLKLFVVNFNTFSNWLWQKAVEFRMASCLKRFPKLTCDLFRLLHFQAPTCRHSPRMWGGAAKKPNDEQCNMARMLKGGSKLNSEVEFVWIDLFIILAHTFVEFFQIKQLYF